MLSLRTTFTRTAQLAPFAFFALALLPQCSTYDDICQQQVDCEGGNDKDVEACVEVNRGLEDVAEAYGCEDQFEAAFDCAKANSTCVENSGQKRFTTNQACNAQEDALDKCQAAATGKGK